MAITLRGSAPVSSFANNGGNVTINLSGLSLVEGDLVIACVSAPRVDGVTPAMVSSGWTELVTPFVGSTTERPSMGVWYKVMGAIPDSSVEMSGDGAATTDTTGIAIALQGVDGSVSDQTPVITSETSSATPDPDQITTQTNGAWVITFAHKSGDTASPTGTPSGYSNTLDQAGSDTYDHNQTIATKEIASAGDENPTSWTYAASSYWRAITIAIKPYESANEIVTVPVSALSITGYAPTVDVTEDTFIEVPNGAFTLTPYAPTATATENQWIEIPNGSFSLTPYAPTVIAEANQWIEIPNASFSLTSYAPSIGISIKITVPAAAFSITNYAPSIVLTEDQWIEIPVASLTMSSSVPTAIVTENQWIEIPAASFTLTSYAPTIDVGAGTIITVPASGLTITGYAPTITAEANQWIEVPNGSLGITAYAPTIDVTANQWIEIPQAALALTSYAPTVSYGTDTYITVPVRALTLTAYPPIINGEVPAYPIMSPMRGVWGPL